jgi:hypothetical protein
MAVRNIFILFILLAVPTSYLANVFDYTYLLNKGSARFGLFRLGWVYWIISRHVDSI